jgi:acyl dehydratase
MVGDVATHPFRGVGCTARKSRRKKLALNPDAVGKTYPPVGYAVGREKVREFASAVGEENELYYNPEAARSAGYADVVAPPMFAVVYSSGALSQALFDPEVGIDFARMVHGGQEFVWGPPVVAGDEIDTEVEVKEAAERGGLKFYVFESRSTNQAGETVCTGTWTNVVR